MQKICPEQLTKQDLEMKAGLEVNSKAGRKVRIFLICSVALLLAMSVSPCIVNAQEGQLRRGNFRYDRLAYQSAIPHFEKYLRKHPESQEAKEKLAESYRLINDPAGAEYWYEQSLAGGNQDPVFRYHYACAKMNNGKLDEAAAEFRKFLEMKPGDSLGLIKLESCAQYRKFLEDSMRYLIRTLDVNSGESDFSAGYWKDNKVVFASSSEQNDWVFSWLGNNFLELYAAELQPDGTLGKKTKLKGRINTRFHEAAVSFTPSGDTMYFTRNNYFKGTLGSDNAGVTLLKTFWSAWNGSRWLKETGMNFNSDDYSAGHPAIFGGGDRMIITSDMPGGLGGTDLWSVERVNGTWMSPVNLGSPINTPGNEMFPWVDPKGNLYFASNGHPGLGGLDVYRARANEAGWNEPENMGYPINTTQDDFSLIMDLDKAQGFLSSNRTGGVGSDDIYAFEIRKMVVIEVVDAVTRQALPAVTVDYLLGGMTMETRYTSSEGSVPFASAGEEMEFHLAKDNYADTALTVPLTDVLPGEIIRKTIYLKPKPVQQDCDQFVYLDGRIISPLKELPPGTKVTLFTREKEMDVQDMRFFDRLLPNTDYTIKIESDTMPERKINFSTKGVAPNDTVAVEFLFPPKEDTGRVFYIIYYNYDKHNIRRDASEELDRVVRFMKKYPNVDVELSAHTDCRGSKEYNMTLSRLRAVEAFDYITSHGIDKQRLTYKWYGESMLVNSCQDGVECPEEDHQRNRRTEFRLFRRY